MDALEAQAREDEWDFDRQAHIEKWREQGWPGVLTPENAQLLHVARLWHAYDDLALAQQIAGLELPRSRVEGVMIRLGMAYRYWRQRAEEERKREQ